MSENEENTVKFEVNLNYMHYNNAIIKECMHFYCIEVALYIKTRHYSMALFCFDGSMESLFQFYSFSLFLAD